MHCGDTTCAAAFGSHPDLSPASPTLPNASSRCACPPLPATGSAPSPAVSRTPTTRCRPTPAPSNGFACDWKTETGVRLADRLPTHPAPIRTTLRIPCACPPLPPRYRSWSPAPDQTRDSALGHAHQFRQIGRAEVPGALDAPSVRQHQRETSQRPPFFDGHRHQRKLLLSTHAPPVIQCRHRHTVLGAILAPRHPALGESFGDVPNLFFASHSAIFNGVARAVKMGCSDAYARNHPSAIGKA